MMNAMATPLVQLAAGSAVEPPLSSVTMLAGWFRGRVLRRGMERLEGRAHATWSEAGAETRGQLSGLSGKDASGAPLVGHAHARYLLWRDGERITRVLAHRAQGFETWEVEAILAAARQPLWCGPGGACVRLVPLDQHVPPPPGFDGREHRVWEGVTPYVPPRHVLGRRGKAKTGESVKDQIARELEQRGLPAADRIEKHDAPRMRVHVARGAGGRGVGGEMRQAYWIRITLSQAVAGPVALGHSSFFGLGLFRPGR